MRSPELHWALMSMKDGPAVLRAQYGPGIPERPVLKCWCREDDIFAWQSSHCNYLLCDLLQFNFLNCIKNCFCVHHYTLIPLLLFTNCNLYFLILNINWLQLHIDRADMELYCCCLTVELYDTYSHTLPLLDLWIFLIINELMVLIATNVNPA